MIRKHLTGWLMAAIAFVLAGSAIFYFTYEKDAYRYFTGLGSTLSRSPDDSRLAFTYYENGKETVYTANRKSGDVKKIHGKEAGEMFDPQFAPDGDGFLYVKRDENGGQSVHYRSHPGDAGRSVTRRYLKVFSAVFSHDGEQIYFVASPVDDGTLPRDITEGTDLYSVGTDGNRLVRLTKDEVVPMSRLVPTPDGKKIYYVGFGDEEGLYAYDIEKKTNEQAKLAGDHIPYDPAISPDGTKMAYSTVAKTEDGDGLFEYEIFASGLDGTDSRQLTHNGKHASAPVFSSDGKTIVYLQQTNWPDDPAEFEIRTTRPSGGGDEAVQLQMPPVDRKFHLDAWADRIVTIPFMAGLYALFFLGWTIRLSGGHGRAIYKPAAISAVFTVGGLSVLAFMIWRDPFIDADLSALAVLFISITAGTGILAFVLHAVEVRQRERAQAEAEHAVLKQKG